ncbi:hypothetical protein Tco_0768700 [Tanacetum coccineum]
MNPCELPPGFWGVGQLLKLPDTIAKNFEHSKSFRFYVIEPNESVSINSIIESRKRDKFFDQQSYCFNVEDDPKTFDEAMKSQDVAFWKEAINDEIDSIMGNNT